MSLGPSEFDPSADAAHVTAVLDQQSCPELQSLLFAAHAIEAQAEDQEWTRIDPVEAPGLRRAAGLVRLLAATHVDTAHGPGRTCPAVTASGGDPATSAY